MSSRIYIDFRDPDRYGEMLQQVVRWAYDLPLYSEPEVGPRPKFLNEKVSFKPIEIRPDQRWIPKSPEVGLVEFFEQAAELNADFNVQMTDEEHNDETVFQGILSLPPIIGQIISVVKARLISGELSDVEVDSIVRYFEAVFSNYDKGSTRWSADVTKFFGQFLFPALLAQSVKFRRFQTAREFLNTRLLKRSYGDVTAEALPFRRLSTNLESLEARNNRLSLGRASIHADVIRQVCELTNIDFLEFMQAEFITYLRTALENGDYFWWPDSNIYATDSHGAFPWFARAVSSPYREQLMGLIGREGREEVEDLMERLVTGNIPQVRWRSAFSTLPSTRLGNFQEIAASY